MTFKKAFLAIAVPVTLQYLLRSSLNLIDTVMVGQLGDTAIAGVGIGNQIYFVMNLFLLGITSGMGIFVAQFYGKGDEENIKKVTGLGLGMTALIALLFSVVAYFWNEHLMGFFTDDRAVIELGSSYLKIVSFSYFATGVTAVFSTVTRTTGKPNMPLIASIVGILMNSIGNYLLIFGIWQFPQLGVDGAGIATVIARLVECSIIVIAVYKYHTLASIKLKHVFKVSLEMIRRFFKQSFILIIKDATWGIGVTLYVVIYAKMGTDVVAAVNIINTVRTIAFVLMMGIAGASSVIIGQELGAGRVDNAYDMAGQIQKVTVMVAIISGVLVMVSKSWVLSLFNISDVVYQNADGLLMIFSLFFVFESYSMTSVMGILRSGADNKFCMYMDFVAIWIIGLPLAYISGILLHLPLMVVYVCVLSPELFKNVVLFKRIRSKRWMNNIVHDL